MNTHYPNRMARDLAINGSLDAAIELDEMIKGGRQKSPALESLVEMLIGTTKDVAPNSRELLSNYQLTNLSYHAAVKAGGDPVNAESIVKLLSLVCRVGLEKLKNEELSLIKDFCLGLNQELVSEAYNRTPEPALRRATKHRLAQANAN